VYLWHRTGATPQVVAHIGAAVDEAQRKAIDTAVTVCAERGLRTVGVARRDGDKWKFLGLMTFLDPPRTDSKETLQRLKENALNVKMITGDHLAIAIETARQLGLGKRFYGPPLLAKLEDGAKYFEHKRIDDLVAHADGFAGVSPKVRVAR
jgi:H+-transporting ATPase